MPDAHVIVVDDEEAILTTARAMLERHGVAARAKLSITRDPLDALHAAQALGLAQRPLVLLTDHDLRASMTGLDLCALVREHAPRSYRVLMSGHEASAFAGRAPGTHADSFLQKPFRAEQLLAAVERGLNGVE